MTDRDDQIRKGLELSKTLLFRYIVGKAKKQYRRSFITLDLLNRASAKMQHYETVTEFKNDLGNEFKGVLRMAKAAVTRNYKDISAKNIVLAIAVIIYFVMPLDIIPDFIPIAGFLDDAALIAWLLNTTQAEYKAYLDWEDKQQYDIIPIEEKKSDS